MRERERKRVEWEREVSMKWDKFEWYKQIKWEKFEWERSKARERDMLCNMLSTNHRKFGEQFPSIFIPKLYRANKNGTNPKTERKSKESSPKWVQQ